MIGENDQDGEYASDKKYVKVISQKSESVLQIRESQEAVFGQGRQYIYIFLIERTRQITEVEE